MINNPFALDAEYEVKNLQMKNKPTMMNGYMVNSLVGTSNKDARGKFERGEKTVIVFDGGEEKYKITLIKAGTPKEAKAKEVEIPIDPVGDAILGKIKKETGVELGKLKEIAAEFKIPYNANIGIPKLQAKIRAKFVEILGGESSEDTFESLYIAAKAKEVEE